MTTDMTPQDTGRVTDSVHYRQVIAPSHVLGTFVGDDADFHDFRVDGRGKGRLTVVVDNDPNQTLTVSVYGAQFAASDVGDRDVKLIGSWTVTADNGANDGYETINDPFPFYVVRAVYAIAPDDDPLQTCVIYVNAQSA